MKNVTTKIKKKDCCGCEACISICPVNALYLKYNSEGFAYPHLFKNKCCECQQCINVCPVLKRFNINNAALLSCYAGSLKQKGILLKSTSGGAAYAMATRIIHDGGVVYSVAYSEDFRYAKYIRCVDDRGINNIRGTKYIQSRKDNCYKHIQKDLKSGRMVAMIGLPCEIAAAKLYMKQTDEKFYTCELICQGPTSEKIQKKFVNYLERTYKDRIVNFNYRYKKDIWRNNFFLTEFVHGKIIIEKLSETDFFPAFAYFLRPSCYNCCFKGQNSSADVTIGDYWGNIEDMLFWDEKGVSAIIARTEKGDAWIRLLEDFELHKTDYSDIVRGNPRLEHSQKKSKLRWLFSLMFRTMGLHMAGDFFRTYRKLALRL